MDNRKGMFIFKNSGFRKAIVGVIRFGIRLLADLHIYHSENMINDGAVMFAANHLSFFDAVVLQSVIKRPLCFMGKAELFENPLVAWFFNQLGAFPVKRGEFDRQSILNARGVLDAGLAMMMFPEGTRTYGKGMVEARNGTAYIAMRNRCPIVPVAISGSEKILKSGLRRATVEITFCEPIAAAEKETAGEFTSRMMRSIASRLPEKLRGFYA